VPEADRVLIDATALTGGGGREYARCLVGELGRDPRRFEITVLASEGFGVERGATGCDLTVIRLPAGPRALRVLGRVAHQELILPFRLRDFDLLYAPADVGPRFHSTPLVAMVQNLHLWDNRFYDNPRLRLLQRRARRTLRGADRVVFPSQAALASVRRRLSLPLERCVVVHHGLTWRPAERTRPATAARPYLFLPCALERHKNLEVLIRSIPHLQDPLLEVWIAGPSETDPKYARQIRSLVDRLGVRPRVRLLGPLSHDEVMTHYRDALALVFCSKLESFGLPLPEAMAAGTPIVAADEPIHREIAGDAALYFRSDDSVELARCVARIAADREATRRRIETGRARVARFSWKQSTDRLCAVFRQVIDERRDACTAQVRA